MSTLYLAEITAYDPGTSAEVTWRFASGPGYDNAGTFYAPRLENPGNVSRAFAGGIGGRTSASLGEITLINNDGGLNALADDYFDGRRLTLKQGDSAAAYGTFTTILSATIETASFERERVSLRLRDRSVELDKPFGTVKYAGNNALPAGTEGTADDLKDKYKPRLLGRVALMAPIVVNTSRLIYQVSEGAVDSIANVYDAGAYLSRGADYTSAAEMQANAPGGGQYRCLESAGMFRLGSQPYGQISACVAEKWAYLSNSAAGLIQRILTEKGYTASDWIAADFTALNQKNAGSLGLLVEDGETTASLLNRICESVGAWWMARLAGVPGAVVSHAKHALAALEAHSQQAQSQVDLFAPPPATAEPEPSALDRAFAQIDPDTLSPREALELVYTLKKLSEKK